MTKDECIDILLYADDTHKIMELIKGCEVYQLNEPQAFTYFEYYIKDDEIIAAKGLLQDKTTCTWVDLKYYSRYGEIFKSLFGKCTFTNNGPKWSHRKTAYNQGDIIKVR